MHFFDVAVTTGSQIASDHGAKSVSLLYGTRIEHLPPSIASGVGQLTRALFFAVAVKFEPCVRPVTRTRKFTRYHPERGVEIWPGGEMVVEDGLCGFDLQVGNATNVGWGVFSTFRNNRLGGLINQLDLLENNPPVERICKVSVLPVTGVETFGVVY
jgi:hypothetical protein